MTQVLQNINPYNEFEFRKKFELSALFKSIEKDFDQLLWNPTSDDGYGGTPRQQWGDKHPQTSKFSMVPFYYLQFLTEKNPEKIYDLGCGWNIFKKYIPNIVGIGAENPNSQWFYADIHDYVDENFIQGHKDYFESVFSICALHFIPISDLRQRVLDFASMIKPSGRGWISFNAMRMLERDPMMRSHPNLELWIRQQLSNLPFQVLQFDVDLEPLENGMDGNIRLILEK
jgi:hypothetical protein